ncbi:MAG: DNA polymerase III subunit gamma/tau [Geminicoccaceae bacterium]
MSLFDTGSSAYRVLARTYRPTRLSELIGQDALARTLRHAFASGRIAHAFLLCGIRGVGKTTTARIIARGLNCTGPDGTGGPTPEPCGVCSSCVSIAEDRSLDVVEMDAASQTGKADVLELLEGIMFSPASSRFKVYILDEVHMLSEKAWNALLKTVEEPPPHIKFVFATTEARRVPVTVLSRCQRFDLRRVEPEVLLHHLEQICAREQVEAEPAALALIARAAEGSVRDSLSLLDQAIAMSEGPVAARDVQAMLGLGDRLQVIELFDALLKGAAAEALDRFHALYAIGVDPTALIQDLLEITYWLSRLKVKPDASSALGVSPEAVSRAHDMAMALSLPILARTWEMLLKGLDEVRNAPDAAAALEMLLMRIACISELPPPGELARLVAGGRPPERPRSSGPAFAPSGSAAPARAYAPPLAEAPAATPDPQTFAELVDRLRQGEPILSAWLHGSVHSIRFEPGRVELRPEPGAPADLAARLTEALQRLTGRRWLVAVGSAEGEPTLADVAEKHRLARMEALAQDPEVKAVLDLFPGSRIVDVRPAATPLSLEKDR